MKHIKSYLENKMPGACCGKKGHKKHTPIVSTQQQRLFAAELVRRKHGFAGKMPGITEEELQSHLHESGGKNLPKKAKKKKKGG